MTSIAAFRDTGGIDTNPRNGDPNRVGYDAGRGSGATGHGNAGPASKRVVVSYGFWLFVLSDIIMFSALFSTYAVLNSATAGGPSGAALFSRTSAAIETTCLLLSSYACGMASIASKRRDAFWFYTAMAATAALGATFLTLEISEFTDLVVRGDGPTRSAFLSAFFTLVGCHGLHVTCGLLWLLTMMAQVYAKGFRDDIMRRVACFALFWHALDIVWVGVFTIVYLFGMST